MRVIAFCLAMCGGASAADVSIERIYWQPNAGGREVALYYDGAVRRGDIYRLTDALDEAETSGRRVTALWMRSSGGDGDTGLALAGWVARHDVDVFVDRDCMSACAYPALVALGRGRLKVTGDARLGVHQVIDDRTGDADPTWTRQAADRLRAYGAPWQPLEEMCDQPPDNMLILDLRKLGAQVMKQPFVFTWY